jgi:3-phosphoshikimate 1-carboxyvinyltransferase
VRLLVKQAVSPLQGQLDIPCSKYHAHRALILASLAPGLTRINGLSDAGHVRHTISALRRLGTRIDVEGETFEVHGGQYHPTQGEVSVGSSGTTLYFLTGLAALADAPVTIVGQRYFQRRPIGPLLEALSGLGVQLSSPTNTPPITVQPRRPTGGEVSISGTLSQWISGLILLAPFATGRSVINVEGELNERTYIDLTLRMMAQFGLHVDVSEDGRRYEIEPNQQPHATTLTLPPDIGSAAFGLAATALHPSDVLFRGLTAMHSSETDHPEADLLDIVSGMGIPMARDPETGWVRVRHDGITLAPAEVDCRLVPDMLPVLSVLGSFADGTTVLDNVAHVRLKESDRVSAMLQLNRMGGHVEQRGNQLLCHGVKHLDGADLSSFNDHRVLMSLAIAATRAEGESRLTFPHAYRISYPRFLDEMNGIGMSMSTAASSNSPATKVSAGRRTSAATPSRAAQVPIGDWVRRWAKAKPDEPAVIDVGSDGQGEAQLSWQELDGQVDRIAALLLDLGVQPGEPVAYQLPNRAEFVVLALAAARIGAISCPLMPIFRQREMAFMLRRSKARVLFVADEFRGRDYPSEVAGLLDAGADAPKLDHVVVLDGDGALPSGSSANWHRYSEASAAVTVDRVALDARRPAPNALAQLLFTSGTSGEPKGVLHRMNALSRAAAMQIRHLSLTSDDRIYIPSPLAHQTGFLYGMWVAVLLGSAQIVQPVWDGRTSLQVLRRWQGTFIQAATPFLADLVDEVEHSGDQPDALRIFVATGAAVPRGLAERATRTLGAAVCGAWGTTETCLGSLSAPGDEPAKCWGTDGRALTGVKIRITDDEGRVLGAGSEGNFEVKSDCLFEGYLDHPEWTAEALTADGWYRSGDLAVIDDSGYVRISGRIKDVVNRGGEKVPVAEIEQLLHTHPAVREVAIVAMPDERLGERACAYVAVKDDATFDLAALQRFLDSAQVAKQYWPERVETVDQLPRNPAGKVQKFLLREQIRQVIDGEGQG